MSELTLTVIKLGFLALLWLLILSVTSAMRSDLFGVRQAREARPAKPAKQRKPARGAPSKIVVVEGPDQGRSAPLDMAPVMFGRGPDSSIPLNDEYVSTRHARLVPHEGQWYVEDLGSTNGTYVGNDRIVRPTPVGAKSRLRLGKTVVELRK
ncbi:MAG: FHA domain-containing protein [Jiangellaceae bacterium]|nr:FHA domain-containing protein [Jiangellaceae bacterium]